MNDKDFLLLINYLTLIEDGITFGIEMAKTIGQVRKIIYYLTGQKLKSIDKKYDDLSVDEYLNVVRIKRLVENSIIDSEIGGKLVKLYYTYLDNEYKKESIILAEYRKISEEHKKTLPNIWMVLKNFTLVKELDDNKDLHIIDARQKDILALISLFSVPKKFYCKASLTSLFSNDIDPVSYEVEQAFDLNYALNIDYSLKDVDDIRDKTKTLNIAASNKFKKDIKNL